MLSKLLHRVPRKPPHDSDSVGAAVEACERDLRTLDRDSKAGDGEWRKPGSLRDFACVDGSVRLIGSDAVVILRWLTADILHVRVERDSDHAIPYPPLRADMKAYEDSTWEDGGSHLILRTTSAVCSVDKHTLSLYIERHDGISACADREGIAWQPGQRARLSLTLPHNIICCGLGARTGALNLRRSKIRLWDGDPAGADYGVPFILAFTPAAAFGLLWRSAARAWVDCGAEQADALIIESESDQVDYLVCVGGAPLDVLTRMSSLMEPLPLPPLWALGYQHVVDVDGDAPLVRALAAQFRRRGDPCDALHLGLSYLDKQRPLTVDSERYPALRALIDELHAQGFQAVAGLHPALQVDDTYPPYVTAHSRRLLVTAPDGQPLRAAALTGVSAFPDFTRAEARTWWSEQLAALVRLGIDGIAHTAAAPTIFRTHGRDTLPDAARHAGDLPHTQVHNIYGQHMAAAAQTALIRHRAGLRELNMLSHGWAGGTAVGLGWLQEPSPTWDGLQGAVRAALNASLSGVPLFGLDVPARLTREDAELHVRWLQAACLLTGLRGHAARGAPWAYGQPFEQINRLTLTLRYRLLPYLYSCIALAREFGQPVIRPLLLADPALSAVDDSFLVGDHLLVAPVLTPHTNERTVRLPPGGWYDFWTHEYIEGGQIITVHAPLERLPLFVRSGTALPLGEALQWVNERAFERPIIRVYPGSGDTSLYEDHGEGTAYLHGDYRWTYVSAAWESDAGLFTISHRHAGTYAPPYTRVHIEVVGLPGEPLDVRMDRQGAPLWYYDDGTLELVATDDFGRIEIDYRPDPDDPTRKRRET
jgi:alpha-glucosidase